MEVNPVAVMNDRLPDPPSDREALIARLEASADLLEAIDQDRALLVDVDKALRERLLTAAGRVSRPDKHARKALARARLKQQKQRRRDGDQALLDTTGIRKLRASPIFFPRPAFFALISS